MHLELHSVASNFFDTSPSVLTDVGGSADVVLAEAVTEADEDALSEEGDGDAAVLEGMGTEGVVSALANTAILLILSSTEE